MQSQHLQLLPYSPCMLFYRNAISSVKNGCVGGWACKCERADVCMPVVVVSEWEAGERAKTFCESNCVYKH